MSAWARLIAAAERPAANLRAALRDPRGAQERLLAHILAANAVCEIGRRYNFSRLRNAGEFRAAVPPSNYDGVAALIERSAAGESGVITSQPILAFERTGGSSSGGKLIAYTQASLEAFRVAVLPWLAELAQRRPGLAKGHAYVSISPAVRRPEMTSGGLPVGLASDAAYLGTDLAPAFAALLAVSPDVGAITDVNEWRVSTLRHLVACEDLSFVSVWSPTFYLELIEYIPAIADELARELGVASRARLASSLSGGAFDAQRLWPRLDTVSCWVDGASGPFAARLAAMLPQAHIAPKGLLATEAPVTIGWGECEGAVPALCSTFIEFIDAEGRSRLADELDLGALYEVRITTPGGLYRYDLGDLVRCVGYEEAAPRLVFEGRNALYSDLVGEKLTESFAARALSGLPCAAALAAAPEGRPHYELWLDRQSALTHDETTPIERALRQNPQYAYARDLGQLGPLVQIASPGFIARLTTAALGKGRRLGDIKATGLLTVEERIMLRTQAA